MDDDGSPLLTIGQLASRTGLAVRTIRYWSDIGTVPPAGRSSGGHRLYDAEVFTGLDAAPELPDEPTPEQVDAWVELAELVQDPEFRQGMRRMAEYHAGGGGAGGPAPGAGLPQGFTQKMATLVGQARQRGIAPDSPQAAQVVDRLLDGADAARRAYVRERLAVGVDSRSDRYHELLAVINGQQARPSHAPELRWLLAAIDSHPA